MKFTPMLVIWLGFLGAAFPADSDDIEYMIVDGTIVVFGHTLVPRETLPEIEVCEECESIHSVGFVRSPDERRVLIISDVHLANFDAWVFDTQSNTAPTRVADKRRGRHLSRSEWHANDKIELFFGGMGYSTSLFIDIARPNDAREIDDPLLYDADLDVYVRYVYDFDTGTDQIEVGTAFSTDRTVERFPIALDNEYLSESRFMIESADIDGTNLVVTYDTTARGKVRDVFNPGVLAEEE